MKLKIINIKAEVVGEKVLPAQFNEKIRPDLIKRAVIALRSHKRQPYGASPEAGKRASAYVSKRRRDYKTTYGIGQSRTPRKVMSRRGTRFNWVGAFAPQTVGGRRAHPPKAEKIWFLKINKKEKRKAIRSAMATSMSKDYLKNVPKDFPFVIDNEIESIKKTKDVKNFLIKAGFKEMLDRKNKVRAGKGKMRGRKFRKKKGPLFIVSDKCDLEKSAKNLAGVDVVKVKNISCEMLAPGINVCRPALYTVKSIDMLEKEKLFF